MHLLQDNEPVLLSLQCAIMRRSWLRLWISGYKKELREEAGFGGEWSNKRSTEQRPLIFPGKFGSADTVMKSSKG
jgi:hypothetical protein